MTRQNPIRIELKDVIQISVASNRGIPNHPHLPALIYPKAVLPDTLPYQIKALYARNRWTKAWVYSLFDYHHYHYAAHEVLTVVGGTAMLQLGGELGLCKEVTSGDVVLLPAGFGHKLVDSTPDFSVVGAYPEGQEDIGYNRAGSDAAAEAQILIAATPLPDCDPIYGSGSLLEALWAGPQR
ncbi:cupin domain-containing protein [Pelagibius sp. Alg239-R121]|uniref:cupin domain-containing protein n=1 Tax=Pelagibius sp. Alg239-R121 TaxID=2993448 RepID=UPI0024A73A43|nr:cupin domain-containing protein [Pelagibius sp. Alg239-R121]